tara:strand:- start:793 stop:1245 length:453 start_codon:yes stop_codon:yes gene_type:complete
MSELEVEVLTEGTGDKPKSGDTVSMHYILYLGDGVSSSNYDYDKKCYVDEQVDSTYDAEMFGGPIDITIGKHTPKDQIYSKGDSIEAFDKALVNMSVGTKCRLTVPPEFAYGSEGASSFHTFHGYRTPPYKGFDIVIELVEIKTATTTSA